MDVTKNSVPPNDFPAVKTTIKSGGLALTASQSAFFSTVSNGALIAALSDPYAGLGLGTTTYSTYGTVPPQLSLSGATIVRGASAGVVGSTYAVGVEAVSGDGKRRVGETLSFNCTVAEVILNALTLSASSFSSGSTGTIIGAIQGLTAGSTVTVSPNDGRVTVDGSNNLVVGGTNSSAGTISISLIETLAGATNSPRTTTPLVLTVNAAVALVNTAPPIITSSSLAIGSTLTASDGTYTGGSITSRVKRWRRAGAYIPGAYGSTYVLQAIDLGQVIDCVETVGNGSGFASAIANSVNCKSRFKFAGVEANMHLSYATSRFWVEDTLYTSVAAAVAAGACVQYTPAGGSAPMDCWVIPSSITTAIGLGSGAGGGITMHYRGVVPPTTGMVLADFRCFAVLAPHDTTPGLTAQAATSSNGSIQMGMVATSSTGPKVKMQYLVRAAGSSTAQTTSPGNMFNMPVGSPFRSTMQIKQANHGMYVWDATGTLSGGGASVEDGTTNANNTVLNVGMDRLVVGNSGNGQRQWSNGGASSSAGIDDIIIWAGTPFSARQELALTNVDVNGGVIPGLTGGGGNFREPALMLANGNLLLGTSSSLAPTIQGFEIDGLTGQILVRSNFISALSGGDDHLAPRSCQTPAGTIWTSSCGHSSNALIYMRHAATVEALHTATETTINLSGTLGANPQVAYGEYYMMPATGTRPNRLYFFFRCGNFTIAGQAVGGVEGWAYIYTDNPDAATPTWSAPKFFIYGGGQYYIQGVIVGNDTIRFTGHINSDDQADTDGVILFDWHEPTQVVTYSNGTKDISGATAFLNVKTDGPGGGKIVGHSPNLTSDTNITGQPFNADGTMFLTFEKHAASGLVDYYTFQYNGSGGAANPANWTKKLVTTGGKGLNVLGSYRFVGGAVLLLDPSLPYPRVIASVNGDDGVTDDGLWHLNQYDLIGGVWTKTASDLDTNTNVGGAFMSRPNRIPNPIAGGKNVTYCKSVYPDFTAYTNDFCYWGRAA